MSLWVLCLLAVGLQAATKAESYVLREGFESGSLPVGWTQEGSSTQYAWGVETNATAGITGVFAGNYHALLRNSSSQSTSTPSKLITPAMDLRWVLKPILMFSHTQKQRSGDVDILRVYYRTDESHPWVMLKEFTGSIIAPQTDTINLPSPGAKYQIAFEGTDRMGAGIALDEVMICPARLYEKPYDIHTSQLTSTSARLQWSSALEADSFHVIVSTIEQNPDKLLPKLVLKDTCIRTSSIEVSHLTFSTDYYVYIQTHYLNYVSEWASFSFRTKPYMLPLPYTQTFDMAYASGTINHVAYWSYGTSIMRGDGIMEYMPFVNQNTNETSRRYYSYTNTTCLVFTGARNAGTPIPAGHYVYAATPELDVEDIKRVSVSFWGTCYRSVGADYESGLIVGVMTDPADFSTFVPVDTVRLTTAYKYDRFTIYLNEYKGDGKYIGFASNFMDKDNIFYLDDVEIKVAPAQREITDLRLTQSRAGSFVVNANMNGNTQMELFITRELIDVKTGSVFLDPTLLPESYIFKKQVISANQLPCKVEHDAFGQFVQVYARPIGSNDFTLPVKFFAPTKKASGETLFIGFEDTEGKYYAFPTDNFTNASPSHSYPFSIITTGQEACNTVVWSSYSSNPKSGKYSISLGMRQDEYSENNIRCKQQYGDYFAMPDCENIQEVMLKFYMRCAGDTPNSSRVAVGVMSDPYDITTFETVATCEVQDQTYRPCIVSFADYKGKGTFPAIMAIPADNKYKSGSTGGLETYTTYNLSYQRIDDITLMGMDGCIVPSEIKAVPTDTSATITWSANGMNKWVVRTYNVTIDRSSNREILTLRDEIVTTTSTALVKGLTPHTKYYYSVAAVCADSLSECDNYSFTTECAAAEAIPYIEDFENWKGGSGNPIAEPMCWTFERQRSGTSSFFPYVQSSNSHSGKMSFCWGYSMSSSGIPPKSAHLALPLMSEDINKLQMTFYAKAAPAYVGDTLYVGVMTDPNDVATFDTISVCRMAENAYAEFVVRFEDYKGTGKYIAFMKPVAKASRTLYLDDIKVDYLSDCEKIQGVEVKNVTPIGADIYWQKGKATTWEIMLSDEADMVQLVRKVVTTMPYTITECPKPNTRYHVSVRAVCDAANESFGEWSNPVSFKTACVPMTAGELGLIDFSHEDELDCWTVGMREGATPSNLPSRNKNGYLFMFNTAATDGAYAIMPTLDIDSITRLQVSFDAHGGTGKDYLRQITVGVISNPADLSTFTAIQTLSLNQVSATSASTDYGFKEAARYTVRFDGYTGDYNGDYGKQIMFLSESGNKANYVYIRNIKVDTIGTCMEPVSVTATEVNTYDATIQWEDLGGDYEVQLLSTDATKVLQSIVVKDTTSVRFTDLKMLTEYSVQVRHICGVGDTSKWSNAIAFRTAYPAAFPLPYSENFDDYTSGAGRPDCWDGFTNHKTAYPYVYSTAKKDGKNGFYMYRSTTNYSYAVLPKFEGDIKDMMISFDYRNAYTSNLCFLEIGVATDVTSVEGIDSTFTLIDSISAPAYVAPNNVWHYYSKMLDTYTGANGYIVLIAPKADQNANGSGVYMDNLYIEKIPTCFRPTNFAFVSATASSITLTWTPFGKETKWDIAYVLAGGEINDATIVTVDTTTAVITGLTHSTNYDFYVRANCGNGDVSGWTDALTHNTLYRVELADAHWNFDNAATQVTNPLGGSNKQEVGWIFGNTKNQAAAYMPYNIKNTYNSAKPYTRNSHYALSDSCALRIGDADAAKNGAYAVLPDINTDMNAVQLRFSGRAIYATGSKVSNTDSIYYINYGQDIYSQKIYKHAIKIGTLTDPYDISTFELLTEYQFHEVTKTDVVADGHWEEVIVSLYGNQGKYIAFLSDYNAGNQVYIDDVVIEPETGCNAPTHIQATELASNKATFTWLSSKAKWNVKLTTGKDSLVEQAVVTKAEWATIKLTEHTDYVLAVQAVDADGTTSKWATYPFITPCVPATQENFAYNFEDDVESYIEYDTVRLLPGCWMGGQMTVSGTSNNNMPTAIVNTEAYQYSRNVGGTTARALRLYNNSTTYTNSYVILPETGFALDSVSLHFWARAAYFYTMDYKTASLRGRLNGSNNKYQRSIVIGAIADVEDLSTFVALDTFTYSQSWSTGTGIYAYNDETGNNYWEEVIIPLTNYAGKGRIMILYPSNGQTSYFFIDDLDIVQGDFCSAATNLQVNNITTHSADLSWVVAGNGKVRLQIATTDDFDPATIVTDVVILDNAAGKYLAESLKSGQQYYFRVQHLCDQTTEAAWSRVVAFTTDYEVRFYEDFSEARTYPVDWNRAIVEPQEILTGKTKLTDKYSTETAAGWTRSSIGGLIADNDIRVETAYGTGSTNNYWLISPIINITDMAAGTNLSLSFLLGLSSNNNGLPNPPLEDDKFFVAVSEDAGLTWKQENTTWWSDAEADNAAYSYKSIPFGGQMYNVDMTKYVGKRIRIAFVSTSNKTASKNYVRLAQVSLNTAKIIDYAASVCHWSDYQDAYFTIDAEHLQVGTTDYESFRPASAYGQDDQYCRMSLTVLPDANTVLRDTICEGSDYHKYHFDLTNVTTSADHKQKLVGSNTCDSIVTLSLVVLPRLRTHLREAICQGDFYEFNGTKYEVATVHSDTLHSLLTGCDSIATLWLNTVAVADRPSSTALIHWTTLGAEEVQLQVSTDESFAAADILVNTTLSCEETDEYIVTGLQLDRTYYYRVRYRYSDESADTAWRTCSFTTEKPLPMSAETLDSEANDTVHKILHDGQVYILRNGKIYDIVGQSVNENIIAY